MRKQLRTISPEILKPPQTQAPPTDSAPTDNELVPSPNCPTCNDAGFLKFDVSPDNPKFGKLYPCSCTERIRAERARAQRYRDSALIGLESLTFRTFNPHLGTAQQAYSLSLNYVTQPKPPWIIFHGPCGSGKTHLAVAIGHSFLEQNIAVRFTVVPDLLDRFYPTDDDTVFEQQYHSLQQFQKTQVLILDGLGSERQTPWGKNVLLQLLRARYHACLQTIITLSTSQSDLIPAIGSWLKDYQICRHVHINTPDVRPLPLPQRTKK